MRPLRIGLNLVYFVRQAGGVGTYARELIPELLQAEPGSRIVAFVSRELDAEDRSAPWAAEIEWVRLPVTVTHGPAWNGFSVLRAQWATQPRGALRRGLDVIHGMANITPLVAPRVATVVTLLDLIWLRDAGTMTSREILAMKCSAIPSARTADRVIAISKAAQNDIVGTLGLRRDRISVTPLGVRVEGRAVPSPESELRAQLDLDNQRVVLCVSQKRTHKNMAGLIRAMVGLDAVLVLPGSPTQHELELRRLATELGISGQVRFPGWLDEPQLERLYRIASCFALPSFQEGFGLTVLEAMGRGVPVCCSNTSSLPEVVGDAGLTFNPEDVDDIRLAIGRLLADPRLAAELAERGRRRSSIFTWRRTAEATLDVYRRAIDERRLLSLDRRRQ